MRFDHLLGRTAVLAFGLTVEVARAYRRHVQKHCERNQNGKESMTRRWRSEHHRLQESFFDPKCAGACRHRCVRLFGGQAECLPPSFDIFPSSQASAAAFRRASR